MNDTLLRTSLLDILQSLGSAAAGVLLAGGYGLYLQQLHLRESAQRTLIEANLWPTPRATQDIDLILSAELVADAQSMGAVRSTLDKLQYKVVQSAKFLQFQRTIAGSKVVKIDLLTAQLDTLENHPAIQANDRRARPVTSDRPELHAHPTDGALLLMESPLRINVQGTLSAGAAFQTKVAIPHPFAYLLMKLTAYRDRRTDRNKDLGRHHALDLFRIVAMLTEPQPDQVQANLRQWADNAQVRSCKKLVKSDFASPTAPGVLAMRQHPLWQNDAQLDVFLEALNELFS